jgi:hypothetical protein
MSPPPDADRRRTAPSYYILTNLGQRDEPPEDHSVVFDVLGLFHAYCLKPSIL